MNIKKHQSDNHIMNGHRARSSWRTLAGILAVIVTFVTTYSLILPAITVSVDQVEEVGGLYLEEDDAEYEIVEDKDEQYELIPQGSDTPIAGYGAEGTLDGEFIEDDDQLAETESEMEAAGIELWDETETGTAVENEVETETAAETETELNTEAESESETETEIETENEAETETEAEADDKTGNTTGGNTRSAIDKNVLASDGKNYKVTLIYGAEAGIPEGAELQVKEILPDKNSDPGINGNRENAHSAHNNDYDEYVSRAQDAFDDDEKVTFARFFDITIVKDGTEIQPSGDVDVRIELTDELSEDIKAVHFGDEVEVLDTARVDAEILNDAVEFTASGFSVYGIVGTVIEKTVLASNGKNYKVTVTYGSEANLPEDTDLSVTELIQNNADYNRYLEESASKLGKEAGSISYTRIFDISLVSESDSDIHYQPEKDVTVSIELLDADINRIDNLKVLHISDDDQVDVLDASTDGNVLNFTTGSFSIYPIVDDTPGGNARIAYRFWYFNATSGVYEQMSAQYFRYSDVQERDATIYEPSIPGMSQEDFVRIFQGWHRGTVDGSTADLSEESISVLELNQELKAKIESEFVEGTYIDLIAELKDAYYITYVDINTNNILSTDLVLKEESDTYFTVKELVKPTRYEDKLMGWRLLEEIDDPDALLYEAGTQYPISSNITLAPVVEGGYWLIFDDNDLVDDGTGKMVSGGASYTAPAFYMNTESEKEVTQEPEEPTRTGYAFGGWYEDEACTIPFTFGELLTKNTTVYAKWIPSDSAYRVIIWKQKSTDKVGIDDEKKTYDYDTSYLIDSDVTTGELIYLDNQYADIYGENGTSTDTDKDYFTYNPDKSDPYIVVKADGSSVINVYYDRVPMTMNFYTWGNGYIYTETTSEDGTQYGLVNGEYVELSHEDGEDIYTYTYSPVYTSTTGDTSTQYGIVEGEYVELDRQSVTTYRPYYIYNPTTGTSGTQYGVVDGEFVDLSQEYSYTYEEYTYTPTTAGSGTQPQYGYYNGEYVQLSYWGGNWHRVGSVSTYNGRRYTRSSVAKEYIGDVNYSYYYGYYYGYVNGELVELTRSSDFKWTYGNGTEYSGNRYSRTRNNTGSYNYTDTRYTRSGNYAPYTYIETTSDSGTQYGVVTSDQGHVQLEKNTTGYIYYYNGEPYTGTRYTASVTPNTYTGQLYRKDGDVFHATEENGEGLYGRDANNVFRLLNETHTPAKLWSYTDSDGVKHYYTGTRYTRSNSQQRSWQLYKSFEGLYGSTLESNGYTWPIGYNWYDTGYNISNGGNANGGTAGNTAGSRMTLKTTFEPLDNSTTANFYGNTETTTGSAIIFYLQNLDGTYTEANRFYTGNNNGSFHINDKYTGFHAASYRTGGSGNWTTVTPKGSDGYYGTAISFNNTFEVRFDRNEYTLTFFTNNGGNDVADYKVLYEDDISGYADQAEGQKTGYYFLGWYADAGYSQRFDFNTTMPDHNVDVYGYWRKERIRVVVVPGANNVYTGSQALTFRLDYDEKISGSMLEAATRTGYILDGWYTDPEFTNKWIFSTPVNGSVEGVDMTYHTASKWASARVAYGDDDEEHANVRGIIHLYAKWIVDTSQKGINVEYDPGEAGIYDTNGTLITTVPIDPQIYQEGSDVVVGSAPSGYNELYHFQYWEAVDSDGNVLEVTDKNGNKINQLPPGTTFNVDGVTPYSHTEDEEGNPVLKTIRLRAKYIKDTDVDSRYTTITYNGNSFEANVYPEGSETKQGRSRDGSEQIQVTYDKLINETIILPGKDDFYLDGYELVGWSFIEGNYEDQTNLEKLEGNINFLPGQMVAADDLYQNSLNDESNILYAMWQPKKYSVTLKQVIESGVTQTSFTYPWKYGVENELVTNFTSGTQTLTGNDSYTWDDAFDYYGRNGDVINITDPQIPSDANYTVRVNAVVTRDDGTKETLPINELGNYEILGDVEITYTYSLKVPVKLEKKSLSDKSYLNGSSFRMTPVEWNSETQKWETSGQTTFEYDMTSVSSKTLNLQEGSYRVTEETAPDNYAKMSEPLLLTVRKDRSFTLRTMTGNSVSDSMAEVTGTDGHTLTVYDRPLRTVTVKKVVDGVDVAADGYVFETLLTLDGSPLVTYDIGGQGLAEDKTNAAGVIQFKVKNGETKALKIPWGTEITIEEKEYAQYDVTTTTASGRQDLDSESDRTFRYIVQEDDTVTFTNKSKVQLLRILKKASDAPDGLAGAVFSLTGLGVKGFTNLTGRMSMDITADPANLGYVPGNDSTDSTLFILPFGSYTLTETRAPQGYAGLTGDLAITVGADGITVGNNDYVSISDPDSDGVYTLTVMNIKQIDITLLKQWYAVPNTAPVQVQLYSTYDGKQGDPDLVGTYILDSDGNWKKKVEDLPAQIMADGTLKTLKYYIVETGIVTSTGSSGQTVTSLNSINLECRYKAVPESGILPSFTQDGYNSMNAAYIRETLTGNGTLVVGNRAECKEFDVQKTWYQLNQGYGWENITDNTSNLYITGELYRKISYVVGDETRTEDQLVAQVKYSNAGVISCDTKAGTSEYLSGTAESSWLLKFQNTGVGNDGHPQMPTSGLWTVDGVTYPATYTYYFRETKLEEKKGEDTWLDVTNRWFRAYKDEDARTNLFNYKKSDLTIQKCWLPDASSGEGIQAVYFTVTDSTNADVGRLIKENPELYGLTVNDVEKIIVGSNEFFAIKLTPGANGWAECQSLVISGLTTSRPLVDDKREISADSWPEVTYKVTEVAYMDSGGIHPISELTRPQYQSQIRKQGQNWRNDGVAAPDLQLGFNGDTKVRVNNSRSFDVNILKTGEDTVHGLAGAHFTLYGSDYYGADGTTVNPNTQPVKQDIVSGSDGKAAFGLLAAGTYYLVETQAPAGYIPLTKPVEIVVGPANIINKPMGEGVDAATYPLYVIYHHYLTSGDESNLSKSYDGIKVEKKEKNGVISYSYTLTVPNTSGYELPSTGGPGTTLIYLLGIMLTGIAGAGLVMRRKRRDAA